jgi:hypothetical protein
MSRDVSGAVMELQRDVGDMKRRLAFVSRPRPDTDALLERAMSTIADLKEENRQFRLKEFWRDFNISELREVVMAQNKRPICFCDDCANNCRIKSWLKKPKGDVACDKCVYHRWMFSTISECGMLVSDGHCVEKLLHTPSCGFQYVSSEDVHFVYSPDTKLGFTYGARLWKAQSTDDPELEKLAKFFSRIQGATMEPFDHAELLAEVLGGFKYDKERFLCR